MDFETFKKELFKNPNFRKEYYNKKDLLYETSEMVEEARVLAGLTQKELAERIGTKQSSIARIERGNGLPSLTFLQKIAKALDTYLIPPKFASMEAVKTSDSIFEQEADERLIPAETYLNFLNTVDGKPLLVIIKT